MKLRQEMPGQQIIVFTGEVDLVLPSTKQKKRNTIAARTKGNRPRLFSPRNTMVDNMTHVLADNRWLSIISSLRYTLYYILTFYFYGDMITK